MLTGNYRISRAMSCGEVRRAPALPFTGHSGDFPESPTATPAAL